MIQGQLPAGVVKWHQQHGGQPSSGTSGLKFPPITPPNGKPRIMLAVDRIGWAFSTRALACKRYLSDEFDLQVGHWPSMVREGNPETDGFYMFWWGDLPHMAKKWPRERLMSSVASWSSWTTGKKSIVDVYEQLKKVAVVTTQNKHLGHFLGTMFKHVFVTDNGVDTKLFQPGELPDTFTPMWCGSKAIHHHPMIKGVQFFLDACKKTGIDPFLIEKGAMEKTHGRILTKPEMAVEYRKASVYVHPSAFEGCSNTLLEAAASGLPCICTNTGVVDELFKDGGAIIVTQDVNEIAEALTYLKNNPDVARKMGEHNRMNVEANWTWEQKVQCEREPFRLLMKAAPNSASKPAPSPLAGTPSPVPAVSGDFAHTPLDMDSDMTFSVVMVSYNKAGTIQRAMDTIAKAAKAYGKDKVEFLWIDDESKDGTWDAKPDEAAFSRVFRIQTGSWPGYRVRWLRNTALQFCRNQMVQYFDPDIFVPENYFGEMAGWVKAHPHCMYAAILDRINPDGTPAVNWYRRSVEKSKKTGDQWRQGYAGFMLFHRSMLEDTGYMDEGFDGGRHVGDVDFALTGHEHGYPLQVKEDISVIHIEHESHKPTKANWALFNEKRGFTAKWHSTPPPVIGLVADVPSYCFDHIAKRIRRDLTDGHTFKTLYAPDIDTGKALDFSGIDARLYLGVNAALRCGVFENSATWVASVSSLLHKQDMLSVMDERLFPESLAIAANSQMTLDLLSSFRADVMLIEDSVDTDFFTPGEPEYGPGYYSVEVEPKDKANPFWLAWAGNLTHDAAARRKGFHYIKYACETVGAGLVIAEVSRAKNKLGRIYTLEEMRGLWRLCDAVVCMSQNEGGPNIVLEAAASGKPVVGSPVGVIPSFVEAGAATLAVRDQNILGQAVAGMMADRGKVKAMGEKARKHAVERWAWTIRQEAWKTLLEKLVKK